MFGPDSQSGLSDRTGIYRSDMVATINQLTARGSSYEPPTRPTDAATPSPSPARGAAT